MTTLQQQLEANQATCACCGEKTHEILVDHVHEPGEVFCSWNHLFLWIMDKCLTEHKEARIKTLHEVDEGCKDAETFQKALDEELIT